MLKLLFIPTGHVFVLPDEEVLKIKAQDRAGEYRILDSGYVEEKLEQVPEKTVQELVMEADKKAEEIENEDKPVVKEEVKEEPKLNFDKMNRKQIAIVLNRVGVPANETETRAVLFEKLKKSGFIK